MTMTADVAGPDEPLYWPERAMHVYRRNERWYGRQPDSNWRLVKDWYFVTDPSTIADLNTACAEGRLTPVK